MAILKFSLHSYLLIVVYASSDIGSSTNKNDLDFNVYGPGLQPQQIVMPARYFFISSRNKDISSLSEDDFDIKFNGYSTHKRDCRVWLNILNRKDGSFIVRYKLYDTCYDVSIIILYKNKHIGDSPYKEKGPVYPEDCYCPETHIEEWLENYGCGDVPLQIKSDLKNFDNINFDSFYNTAVSMFNNSHSSSVCHYVLKNNNVYRNCFGKHVGFKMFMDDIILSLARKAHLPDFEFFTNLGDWPLMKKGSKTLFPLFSWCGSKDTLDIVMPTYVLTQSSLECMGRVSLDMLSVQGNIEKNWTEKIGKLFWRGRDSSRERLKLIEIARNNPDIFNASITNFFFFQEEQDKYGPKVPHVSFFKFFDYKYQMNMDGTVAAYRFPYLLAGDSLVLKQNSNYYEHFYGELTPWEHYVPVSTDLSDMTQVVRWAMDNDGEALAVSRRGQAYARRNLLPQQVFCYHAHLFNEWSKKLISKVRVREGMENVPQKENDGCSVASKTNSRKSDEL